MLFLFEKKDYDKQFDRLQVCQFLMSQLFKLNLYVAWGLTIFKILLSL